MNGFREITAAGAIAVMGAFAAPASVAAATPDVSPAPSAIRAVESNALLHGPAADLMSNVPSGSRYMPRVRVEVHYAPVEPRDSIVPDRRETMRLQRALNRDGASLAVNGAVDQRTMTALLNYQSDHGLAATGRLDGVTKTLLNIG